MIDAPCQILDMAIGAHIHAMEHIEAVRIKSCEPIHVLDLEQKQGVQPLRRDCLSRSIQPVGELAAFEMQPWRGHDLISLRRESRSARCEEVAAGSSAPDSASTTTP